MKMKSFIKHCISSLQIYVMDNFIAYIPSHDFRNFCLKINGAKIGNSVRIQIGCRVRRYKNLSVGNDCLVLRGAFIDALGGGKNW